MSTRPYPSYKDSGVEWLGRIPAQWQVKRLKFAAPACDVKLAEKPSGSTYVGLENIEPKTGRLLLDAPVELVDSTVVAFRRGDVLFGKLRPYLAKVVRPDFDGVATTELLVLRPHDGLDAQFLTYRLLAPDSIELINASTYGAKMPRANGEQVGNLAIAWPSLQEQQSIAEFLDRETGKFDALVKKKERLIELLLEKRTALISHAVTQGLNPNAPKKDSGIPWLGHIPQHWDVRKFGQVAFFQEGPGLRNWQFTDSGVRVICVTNITEAGIDFSNYQKFISNEEYSASYRHFTVQVGDLLLSSSGNSWGKVAEYRSADTSILNTSTIRVNADSNGNIRKEHLKWMLQSDNVRSQLGLMMTGSCQPNFGPSHLNKAIVPVPPQLEQSAIAAYLERVTAKLEALMAKVRTAMERLQEYRTALISAAVTGQIDVRSGR